MAKPKYYWKIWIGPNNLTPNDKTNGIAYISTSGKTLRNADIARQFVKNGTELHYETIFGILEQRDRIVRRFLQQGSSVIDGVCKYTPRVKGPWDWRLPNFNSEKNYLTLDLEMANLMQADLQEVGLDILGKKPKIGIIGLVTNTFTGASDGTITPNEDILIEGDRIKIVEKEPGQPEVGVFFIAENGTEYKASRMPTVNNPKSLIVRVPELPSGHYSLRLVTFFSNASTILTSPRFIDFLFKLTVP